MAFIITRLQVGDYDAFKPLFDQDSPGTRTTDPAGRCDR